MIVEDEEMMSKTLVERFNQEGFKVFAAKDGEAGLKMALEEEPTIILLDILLPKMDGMQVLQKLRESGDWGKNVPVIMLTNLDANDNIIERVAKDKPTYYLIKSDWSLDKIVEKVNERLKPM